MASWSANDDERIGRYVRQLRRARGLTLTQLAALAELSQPFLSQLERGLARPSMASLSRIAYALGSSQLEIIAGAVELDDPAPGPAPTLVRAEEGSHGRYGLGEARLLVAGDRPFYPMTFVADNTERGDFHRHPEGEFLHVLEGTCSVDLGRVDLGRVDPSGSPEGEHYELGVGDSLYYAGGTPHRWYSRDGAPYRLFVVKQHVLLSTAARAAAPQLVTDLIGATP